jgi:hypothetical protein
VPETLRLVIIQYLGIVVSLSPASSAGGASRRWRRSARLPARHHRCLIDV